MIKISIIIAIIISSRACYSQGIEDRINAYIIDFRDITDKYGEEFWGIKVEAPIMFVDSLNKVAFLSQSSDDTKEKVYKNLFILPLTKEMINTSPIVEWNSQNWIVVFLPILGSRKELIEFIAHESFHCVQNRLSIEGSTPSIPHLSTVEGKTLMYVELAELLKAYKEQNLDQRKAHLINAVSIRNHRYVVFPNAQSRERQSEMNEGLAKYTGMNYAGYSEKEKIEYFDEIIEQLKTLNSEAIYPYISGSLYAFINDEASDQWRGKIPEQSVYEITISLYGIIYKEEFRTIVDSLLKQNEYIEIGTSFSKNSIEELKSRFSYNRLQIDSKGSTYQFRSNIVVSIPNMGTVYNKILISNEWGELDVGENGRVLVSQEDNIIVLNSDNIKTVSDGITGDGWYLKIDNDWIILEESDGLFLKRVSINN